MTDALAILLVHGAWHNAACWDKVRGDLESRGREVHTIELPTVHADNRASLDMYDDARAVRAAIEAIGGPVLVVAHSYGGVPVTQGAAGVPNVAHIVFVSAFALDQGESMLTPAGGVPPSWWNVQGDFVTPGVPGQPAEHLFYNDLPDDEARAATAQLRPQPMTAFNVPVTEVAWKTVPSTYVITLRDTIFPLEAMEGLAARAGSKAVRIEAGHSPFLSRPQETADIIVEAAG